MRIEVEFTEDPSRYPNQIATLDFEESPNLQEVGKVRQRILKLYSKTDGYVVDLRVAEFEWGASAGEVFLAISLAANLWEIYRGLHSVFDWATRNHREEPYLDSASAEQAARLSIATRWDTPASTLRKVKEGEATGQQGWKFVFLDDREVEYTAEILATKSGVPTTYVTADWTAIGGAPIRHSALPQDGEVGPPEQLT